jgi:hypothetical protein
MEPKFEVKTVCLAILPSLQKHAYSLKVSTFALGGAELTVVVGLKIEAKGVNFKIKRGLYLCCNLLRKP